MIPKRPYSLEDQQRDAGEMWTRADRYRAELADIYKYFMPWRSPTIERQPERGGQTEGAKMASNVLFDSTGPSAAFGFVANMKSDWMPAFDPFFKLENGPLYPKADKNAAAQRQQQLDMLTEIAHGLLTQVRLSADEMFADLFGGTGNMFLSKGDKRGLIRGVAVPAVEVALDTGPWGDVERWHWKRTYKARQVEQAWPDGKFSDRLARMFKDNRNADLLVSQYTYWCPADEMFKLSVWCNGDPQSNFHTERFAVQPWASPRFMVVPGEAHGRGLAHLGLPSAKTTNKARELALRAAAFALLGLWTRRNDGVFNPETAMQVPGAFWKVACSDGPLKTIQRLDVPKDFDIASIIIKDEREQLRRVLLDDELPELQDSVRTPTEIAGRMRRYDRNRGGATTRLALELVTPIVQRAVDIMAKAGLMPKGLEIDGTLTKVSIAAPAAAAMRTDRVERIVNWVQIMSGLFGPQVTALNATIEEILPGIARDLGVEEKYIRKATESEQLKLLIDAAVAADREAQKAAEANAPPMPPPAKPSQIAQQFVNGGMA